MWSQCLPYPVSSLLFLLLLLFVFPDRNLLREAWALLLCHS